MCAKPDGPINLPRPCAPTSRQRYLHQKLTAPAPPTCRTPRTVRDSRSPVKHPQTCKACQRKASLASRKENTCAADPCERPFPTRLLANCGRRRAWLGHVAGRRCRAPGRGQREAHLKEPFATRKRKPALSPGACRSSPDSISSRSRLASHEASSICSTSSLKDRFAFCGEQAGGASTEVSGRVMDLNECGSWARRSSPGIACASRRACASQGHGRSVRKF